MSDYYTHQKYLQEELTRLQPKSVVLELGAGEGSSPLMYEYCKNNPTSKVISFESDVSWYESMFEKYGDLPNYIFNLLDDWTKLNTYVKQKKLDLVFVDQSPWQARIDSIDSLKTKTNLFIVHDYDYYNIGTTETTWINEPHTWWSKTYSEEFTLEDNYEILPPTLIMRKRTK
jgi:hypothetical protein